MTLFVATRGVMLALTRKPGRGTLRAAGYGFLAVGGGWTWAEAAGVYFGFGPVIALLTGVHFHYAGLAMQVLAWRAAGTRAGLVAGWGVTVGTPLVGVSFLVSPWASLGSTLVLAASGVLLALVQVRLAPGLASPVARALLWVSSGSFMAGMALAAAYAAGVALETYWLSIPTMAGTHGLLNGVGFTLCALLAHTLNPAARG